MSNFRQSMTGHQFLYATGATLAASPDRIGKVGPLEQAFGFLALLFCTGAFVSLWMAETMGDLSGVRSSLPVLLIQVSIYLILLLFILRRIQPFWVACRFAWPMWLISALAVASILWSASASITAKRSAVLIGMTMMGVYIGLRYTITEQVRLVAGVMLFAVVASALSALFLPALGIDSIYGDWIVRGVFLQKNHLGRVAAMGVLAFFLLTLAAKRRKLLWVAGFVTCAIVLLFSFSITSIFALTFCLLAYFPLRLVKIHWHVQVPLWLCSMGIAALLTIFLAENFDASLMAMGRDRSFSGRDELWDVLLQMIGYKPWLGYGLHAFWFEERFWVWRRIGWMPMQAHSGYLETLLDIGAVGLTLLLVAFLFVGKRAYARLSHASPLEGAWPAMILLFIILSNLTESVILRQNNIQWVLLTACAVRLLCEDKGSVLHTIQIRQR